MKRKIFTLLLSAFLGTMAMAQDAPTGVVKKAPVAPVIDGYVDEVWAGANSYNIALPFGSETPTVGNPGETTWRALWTSEGIYVLVQVTDDVFMPHYKGDTPGNAWMYDKPEVYFDCNEEKMDGLGAQTNGLGNGNGHYQFAPSFIEAMIGGGEASVTDDSHQTPFAFHVVGSSYVAEYFVPFTILLDGTGAGVNQTAPIGFDVTVIDSDVTGQVRHRAVWANTGSKNESWVNMDDCGIITLSDEEAVAGAIINKATVAPEIDGKVDEVWESANTYNINKPFFRANVDPTLAFLEAPTLGESTWKALWNDTGMFILLEVDDDNWYPNWVAGEGLNDYMFDKPELYFDTNVPRLDKAGGQCCSKGSIQIAPGSAEGKLDGSIQTANQQATNTEYNYAFLVTEPKYVVEYYVPWEAFADKDDKAFDKMTSMGFDVTLIDQDPGTTDRARAVWMNEGTGVDGNESWSNMDGAGVITFYGAAEVVDVEDITVTGGSITTDNGTLQMVAEVSPDDASVKSVNWIVENGTGRATISTKGVLTGVINGTVLVKAVAKDGTDVEGKTTVTITGQKVTMDEINYLKNGNFDNKTAAGGPVDWSTGIVTDGVLIFGPDSVLVDPWSLTLLQRTYVPFALKDEDYLLSFKAWADEPRTLPLVFEDATADGNQWDAYASSDDPGFSDKTWTVDLTTEPAIYQLNLNFSKMQETTVQNFNFQVGKSAAKIHLDSIYLVNKNDLALVTSVKSLTNSKSKVQLYPNPVQTELTISKIAVANSKVSVYNALGQKLMEKTAIGNQAKFDVANLRKGMYFVRFSDGTTEKFTKQ